MQEVAAADRAQLALGEEAGHGGAGGGLGDPGGVVVGGTEEAAPAAVAGEQQHPAGAHRPGPDRREQRLQLLAGGGRVAHVELHGLADRDGVADRQGAALRVGAEEVADQEVPAAELGLVLVDHPADLHAAGKQRLHPGAGAAEQLLQPLHRRTTAKLVDQVAGGAGDGIGGADRAAALAHHRADLDRPAQHHPDRATRVGVGTEQQPVAAGLGRARRHPADHWQPGPLQVEPLDEQVRWEAERVGQQHHVSSRGRGHAARLTRVAGCCGQGLAPEPAGPPCPLLALLLEVQVRPAGDRVALVQLHQPQMEGVQAHAGQARGPQGQRRGVLQLQALADHALGGAAEHHRAAAALGQLPRQVPGNRGVLHREEADNQVGLAAGLGERGGHGLVQRPAEAGSGGDGSAEAEHAPHPFKPRRLPTRSGRGRGAARSRPN